MSIIFGTFLLVLLEKFYFKIWLTIANELLKNDGPITVNVCSKHGGVNSCFDHGPTSLCFSARIVSAIAYLKPLTFSPPTNPIFSRSTDAAKIMVLLRVHVSLFMRTLCAHMFISRRVEIK